jgi:hypothetical protein
MAIRACVWPYNSGQGFQVRRYPLRRSARSSGLIPRSPPIHSGFISLSSPHHASHHLEHAAQLCSREPGPGGPEESLDAARAVLTPLDSAASPRPQFSRGLAQPPDRRIRLPPPPHARGRAPPPCSPRRAPPSSSSSARGSRAPGGSNLGLPGPWYGAVTFLGLVASWFRVRSDA